jgi:hypothetical protein
VSNSTPARTTAKPGKSYPDFPLVACKIISDEQLRAVVEMDHGWQFGAYNAWREGVRRLPKSRKAFPINELR